MSDGLEEIVLSASPKGQGFAQRAKALITRIMPEMEAASKHLSKLKP